MCHDGIYGNLRVPDWDVGRLQYLRLPCYDGCVESCTCSHRDVWEHAPPDWDVAGSVP
jgi:hypothetical protein